MEAPNVRLEVPMRLLRVGERSRLERLFLNDAYECLVPVVQRGNGAFDVSPSAPQHRFAEDNRVGVPGGFP